MDTNTGESPGYQSQSQQLGNSPSEEEMGHWTPTGIKPKDNDDDDQSKSFATLGQTAPLAYRTYSHPQFSYACKLSIKIQIVRKTFPVCLSRHRKIEKYSAKVVSSRISLVTYLVANVGMRRLLFDNLSFCTSSRTSVYDRPIQPSANEPHMTKCTAFIVGYLHTTCRPVYVL